MSFSSPNSDHQRVIDFEMLDTSPLPLLDPQSKAPETLAAEAEFERRRVARQLVIPTDDKVVRRALREVKEMVELPGESAHDRRERLREVVSHGRIPVETLKELDASRVEKKSERTEERFIEGDKHILLPLRRSLAEDSIMRAKQRLRDKQEQHDSRLYSISGSQYVSDRPASAVAFMNEDVFITGTLGGHLCKWSTLDFERSLEYAGRMERIDCIQRISDTRFAVSGQEGGIGIYDLDGNAPVASLNGHEGRVPRLALHPSGRFLASTSYDKTWRLWDIAKEAEMQKQMAHHGPVYGIAFHPDGGLVGTSSLDALARIWDCRTGRCIWTLEQGGHADAILSIDFCPDGRQICTAGQDNGIRIWDLRRLGHPTLCIPAHTSTVTLTKFLDHFTLASCSFDCTIKIWSITSDWRLVQTLEGHEGKVLAIDYDSTSIASVGFDRTVKLWSS